MTDLQACAKVLRADFLAAPATPNADGRLMVTVCMGNLDALLAFAESVVTVTPGRLVTLSSYPPHIEVDHAAGDDPCCTGRAVLPCTDDALRQFGPMIGEQLEIVIARRSP